MNNFSLKFCILALLIASCKFIKDDASFDIDESSYRETYIDSSVNYISSRCLEMSVAKTNILVGKHYKSFPSVVFDSLNKFIIQDYLAVGGEYDCQLFTPNSLVDSVQIIVFDSYENQYLLNILHRYPTGSRKSTMIAFKNSAQDVIVGSPLTTDHMFSYDTIASVFIDEPLLSIVDCYPLPKLIKTIRISHNGTAFTVPDRKFYTVDDNMNFYRIKF